MIEVKNLCKTYKPKKGPEVQALQDVSLKFGETGMVFILGKSGSGKSTLLNILGGLDSYDSGEFIIEGKSSNEFSQADLDSYRNTLIGFIFQEYNILEEFTVGANIALAMQLQGKKSTAEALNKILDEVDLADYGGRKPNELSGGQKQRVAIARALIKDPRIIMADEPTGALDSNTGRQVFDTLKKLSKDKLVIIVSHDREFAEYYGDRVIELADGKIISDISKYEAKPDTVSDGISIVDGRIMQIKKGYKLNNKDVAMINDYLAAAETDALLTVDERSNRSFKQIAMISDDGGKQSFAETDNNKVSDKIYNGNNLNLIKSRLPYKHSLKMGASSLKSKPLKLIFTILLSFIAFALFGVADTLGSYNEVTAAYSSVIDFNVTNATFSKKLLDDEGYYGHDKKITDADIELIKQNTGLDVRPVYGEVGQYNFYDNLNLPAKLPTSFTQYYKQSFSGVVVIDQKLLDDSHFALIGRLPANEHEIVIPKHIYDTFAITGYKSKNGKVKYTSEEISTPQFFVDKNLTLEFNNNQTLTVVGIVETNFNANGRYDDFKSGDFSNQNGVENFTISGELNAELNFGYHAMMFIHSDYAKIFNDTQNGKIFASNEYCTINLDQSNNGLRQINPFKNDYNNSIKYIGDKNDAQGVALPSGYLRTYLKSKISVYKTEIEKLQLTQEDRTLKRINYNNGEFTITSTELDSFSYFNYVFGDEWKYQAMSDALLDMDLIANAMQKANMVNLWNSIMPHAPVTTENITNQHAQFALTQSLIDRYIPIYAEPIVQKIEVEMYAHVMTQYDLFNLVTKDFSLKYRDYNVSSNEETVIPIKLIGIYYGVGNYTTELFVSDNVFNALNADSEGYHTCIAPMPTDKNQIKKVIEYSYKLHDLSTPQESIMGYSYMLLNTTSTSLNSVGSTIAVISKVFLYIGIGFALFASLLLMNFISSSISYKKREIGILRAVGARGSDVFGIFCNESMIIALINFVLATIATVICCTVLNGVFAKELGISVTILSFGIRQVALLFFVAIGAAFIASLLPVMKIAHKRPIDAIRNR